MAMGMTRLLLLIFVSWLFICTVSAEGERLARYFLFYRRSTNLSAWRRALIPSKPVSGFTPGLALGAGAGSGAGAGPRADADAGAGAGAGGHVLLS